MLDGGCEQFQTQPVLLKSLDENLSKKVTAYTAENVARELQAIPWGKIELFSKDFFPIIKSQICVNSYTWDEVVNDETVVSLHEYTGLLKNNSKYSQKYLAKKQPY